jgi:protein-S-isoprenylcysteine O-methyltransferase Ste14
MFPAIKMIIFVIASMGFGWISRTSMSSFHSRGFYRFLVWEILLVLFLMNINYWFWKPFSFIHLVSWIFLIFAAYLISSGVWLLRKSGKIDTQRNDESLLGIEKTTQLVTSGIYKLIRHPFYSSLFFLGWGILLKQVTWIGLILSVITSVLLIFIARKEELENIKFFGESYQAYMKQTRMFIPFVF